MGGIGGVDMCAMVAEHERIEWEVRPGGMLVQKRRAPDDDGCDDGAGEGSRGDGGVERPRRACGIG